MPSVQTKDIVGNKTKLSYSTDDGTTWTEMSRIIDVQGNKISAAEIPNGDLASVAKTSQPGIPDYGEVAFTLALQVALVAIINGWVAGQTVLKFKVELNDKVAFTPALTTNTAETFSGWVKEIDRLGTIKDDERILSKVTIRITGVDTVTAGA